MKKGQVLTARKEIKNVNNSIFSKDDKGVIISIASAPKSGDDLITIKNKKNNKHHVVFSSEVKKEFNI